jgi:hypothetical protein
VFIIGSLLFVALGCRPEDIGEITIKPSQPLSPGQSAILSIQMSGLGANDVVQWSGTDGKFTKDTDKLVTAWVAPDKAGPVFITCQVTSGGKTTVRHLGIDVVEQSTSSSKTADSAGIERRSDVTPPAHAQPTPVASQPSREPHDVEQTGFIPSGWMGDGAQGTKYVQVIHHSQDKPHSEPYAQKWTYQPGSLGWAAIAWQFPENNWGDRNGKDLRNRGFTRVTVWARGLKGGEIIQFKAGGHTAPAKPYQASFDVAGEFIKLTSEWKQYTLNIEGQNLTNVISAFAWAIRKEDNPNGATFYLDDIQYE